MIEVSNNKTKKRIDAQLTHFSDGRNVTPRKIPAAHSAALSFFPPLAAFTAAIAAADFCRSTGSLNTGAEVFDSFTTSKAAFRAALIAASVAMRLLWALL